MIRKLLLSIAILLAPVAAEAAARFAVCTTTCTWDGASTAMWSTISGGGTGASVPGSADTVTLDAATCVGGTTCTITVNTNPNIVSLTMGLCTASTAGCILDFSAHNNTITVQTVSLTGAGTRTLNCGTGTWTVSGDNATVWDNGTVTSETLNCTGNTIDINDSLGTQPRTVNMGTKTYGTVTINASSPIASNFLFQTGSPTFSNLTFGTNVFFIRITSAVTLTTTGTFTLTDGAQGVSGQKIVLAVGPGAATLNVANAVVANWWGMANITKAGTGSITINNGFDFGGNTGITIINPVGAGGGGGIIGG